jgi:rhodanese-related sulfurtransferase
MLSNLFQRVATIDVADAARRLEAGEIVLVDVREAGEWHGGHVPGARHIPLAAVPGTIDELARHGKPIAFICGSGHRSRMACATARGLNVATALNVDGGMHAWQRAGLPTTRP